MRPLFFGTRCLTILPRELFQHQTDSTEHITQRDWKTPQRDTQSCVPIKLWSIPVIGWFVTSSMGPVIPEIYWSMPSGEKQKDEYRSLTLERARLGWNEEKNLWIAGIFVVTLVLIVGIVRYIEVQKCENDPAGQIAKEIYKVENALKKVDADYECQSVAKVTPFLYTDSKGNTIVYYCIQTAYLENESGDDTGLDMDTIGMVIDLNQIESRRECMVNEYDAFLFEISDRTYLCWTLSPEISCVIEYDAAITGKDDILRMAESIG